jgi:hypothetical protein
VSPAKRETPPAAQQSGGVSKGKMADFQSRYTSLDIGDVFADFLFALAEPLLETSEEFVLFAFFKCQVIIGKLAVFLLELAFDLVPVAFHL